MHIFGWSGLPSLYILSYIAYMYVYIHPSNLVIRILHVIIYITAVGHDRRQTNPRISFVPIIVPYKKRRHFLAFSTKEHDTSTTTTVSTATATTSRTWIVSGTQHDGAVLLVAADAHRLYHPTWYCDYCLPSQEEWFPSTPDPSLKERQRENFHVSHISCDCSCIQ
jgi:hypothetical protein